MLHSHNDLGHMLCLVMFFKANTDFKCLEIQIQYPFADKIRKVCGKKTKTSVAR